MNRFIINLKSLNTANSSQNSSGQQRWSRFSTPDFCIPDSFLGNIGEDLQHGHEPADGDNELDDIRQEMDVMSPNIHASLEHASEAIALPVTDTTIGPPISRPVNAQVSVQIHS